MKPELKSTSFSCSFKQAAIRAVKNNFPEARINGCLFQLAKNF